MVDADHPGFNDTEGEAPAGRRRRADADAAADHPLPRRVRAADAADAGGLPAHRRAGPAEAVNIDLKLPDGQNFNATGLQVVDEAKLRELRPDTAAELLRNGLMLLLHAHLISSGNVNRLGERLAVRLGVSGAATPGAPTAA
jgi:hypothetical protein